eukprot:CAMPEP_0119301232 /NCGR_PEP_ID=MMETSP1333-20130426/3037_1 /TAXON_ID=418940 /ORGANISM="Scyphosphaera apsteinii, Strain RCC1455" /LENGTH=210 /DNA_ID=CAMNT_0007303247 /DNA_START=315 /DNA_END=947 /DNA_ORIENTATION=+
MHAAGIEDRVERVVDGDTVVLQTLGRARLIGVNTPETVAPAQKQGAPPQCFGPEASQYTKAQLPPGTRVRVETDALPKDKYDRSLVYLFREPDDAFINANLIASGFGRAKVYPPNTSYDKMFASLQEDARSRRKGLWGQCDMAPQPARKESKIGASTVALANPGDAKNCNDFASYAEAKDWYDTYFPAFGDVAKLDRDGDGMPCESLLKR